MQALIIVLIVILVGFIVWNKVEGSPTPNAPDVNAPDPEEIVRGTDDAAKGAADTILGLPPEIWTFIVPLIIVCIIIAAIWRSKPLRMAVIVIACMMLGIWVASNVS